MRPLHIQLVLMSAFALPACSCGDEVALSIVPSTSIVALLEGESVTLDVRLAHEVDDGTKLVIRSSRPDVATVSPAELVFGARDWSAPHTITIAGQLDADAMDGATLVTFDNDDLGRAVVSVGVTDLDSSKPVIEMKELVMYEHQARVISVRLDRAPGDPVAVFVRAKDPALILPSPSELVFTRDDFDMPRWVTIGAGEAGTGFEKRETEVHIGRSRTVDAVVKVTVIEENAVSDVLPPRAPEGAWTFTPPSATRTPVTPTTPNPPVEPPPVTPPGPLAPQRLITAPSDFLVPEGGSGSFTVSLARKPALAEEIIAFRASDGRAVTIVPESATFTVTDWDVPQVIRVFGTEDGDVLDARVTIELVSSDVTTAPASVTATVDDDEIQRLVFDPRPLALREGGAPATFGVRLAYDPGRPVTVTVRNVGDADALRFEPEEMTFDGASFDVPQTVTVTPVQDVDLAEESVPLRIVAPGAAPGFVTAEIADDDAQLLVVAANEVIEVVESRPTYVPVRLAFRPSAPVEVRVTTADPSAAFALPATLIFGPDTWATPQVVQVIGAEDLDLEPARTSVTFATAGVSFPEAAFDVTLPVDVADEDRQRVVFTREPALLEVASVQEGGPSIRFRVSLEYPPRVSDGGVDVVQLSASDPSRLDLSTDTLVFDRASWNVPQVVTVRAPDDSDRNHESIDVRAEIRGDRAGALPVRVIDDEETIVARTTYAAFHGSTRGTERQDVRWGGYRLAVTARNAAEQTVALSERRELDGASVGPVLVTPSAEQGVMAALGPIAYDGSAFGMFVMDANGLVFVREAEDMAQSLAFRVVSGSGTIDHWEAWNGNGYGVVYRNMAGGNLSFVNVALDGSAQPPVTITAPGSQKLAPNLHYTGGGYTLLYSSATQVRCARLDIWGRPISDVALPGFPIGGARLASVWSGEEILGVFVNPSPGLSSVRISADCEIIDAPRSIRSAYAYPSPPVVAWNGREYAVAYEMEGPQVGVVRLGPEGAARDDVMVGPGMRPSITWAADRWVMRYEGVNAVELRAGSFQTHCGDEMVDEDESGLDCGGRDCRPCALELSVTDLNTDDMITTALWDFFTRARPDASEWISFEITGDGAMNPGAWCAQRADFYAGAYLAMSPTGGSAVSGAWERWYRPASGQWEGPVLAATPSYFGTECFGVYSWCPEWNLGGRALALIPGATGGAELYADSLDTGLGWRATVRLGADRFTACGF